MAYRAMYFKNNAGPWTNFFSSDHGKLVGDISEFEECVELVKHRLINSPQHYPVGVFSVGYEEPLLIVQVPDHMISDKVHPNVTRMWPTQYIRYTEPIMVVI